MYIKRFRAKMSYLINRSLSLRWMSFSYLHTYIALYSNISYMKYETILLIRLISDTGARTMPNSSTSILCYTRLIKKPKHIRKEIIC